jgi:uncharacterized protein (DUF427 family)
MTPGQRITDLANDYPATIVDVDHVEPVPRRIRGIVAGQPIVDTTRALYVWEWPHYPQYYIPVGDVRGEALVRETDGETTPRGVAERYGVRVGDVYRAAAAQLFLDSPLPGLRQTVRFEWSAMDGWFEEDEQVFVHPRNPYVRVDALPSTRDVRVELDGSTLAESSWSVLVFETGLPTRYYLNRLDINWAYLTATDTVTECPYKGRTTGYWSVRVGERVHPDIAWSYEFPTRQVLPIAGLVAFYNERVDIVVDGRRIGRPKTHFSRARR